MPVLTNTKGKTEIDHIRLFEALRVSPALRRCLTVPAGHLDQSSGVPLDIREHVQALATGKTQKTLQSGQDIMDQLHQRCPHLGCSEAVSQVLVGQGPGHEFLEGCGLADILRQVPPMRPDLSPQRPYNILYVPVLGREIQTHELGHQVLQVLYRSLLFLGQFAWVLGLKVTMERTEVVTAEPENSYVQKDRTA